MANRVVQTVLVKRRGSDGFTKSEATKQVRALRFSADKIDSGDGDYWRFRQISPSKVLEGTYRTFQVKPGVMLVYAEPIAARSNPTPSAWSMGPDRGYVCKTDLLGKKIPGVKGRGAKVVSCATPPPRAYVRSGDEGYRLSDDPRHRAHRKGQVMLEAGGKQWPVSRTYATRQLRDRAAGKNAFARGESRNEIEGRIRDLEAEPFHVPVPVGHEFRHRKGSNICAPDHPMWSDPAWLDAVEAARDRASARADRMGITVESGDTEFRPNPATTYEELLVEELRRDPRSRRYFDAEAKCIEWFRARNFKRRHKGYTSPQFLAAERRREASQAGVDVTSAEYRDTLEPKSRKTLRSKKTRRTKASKSRPKR